MKNNNFDTSMLKYDFLTLNINVNSIGTEYCKITSLTEIYISKSVETISSNAFEDIKKLERIVVDPNNKTYDSRDNCNAIIDTSSKTLIKGCKNTVIPNGIVCIGENAFKDCKSLKHIEIPDSVICIEEDAFKGCISLENMEIPDSVKVIGEHAFDGCKSLTNLKISSDVIRIGQGTNYDHKIILHEFTDGWLFNSIIYFDSSDYTLHFSEKAEEDPNMDYEDENCLKTYSIHKKIASIPISSTPLKDLVNFLLRNLSTKYTIKIPGNKDRIISFGSLFYGYESEEIENMLKNIDKMSEQEILKQYLKCRDAWNYEDHDSLGNYFFDFIEIAFNDNWHKNYLLNQYNNGIIFISIRVDRTCLYVDYIENGIFYSKTIEPFKNNQPKEVCNFHSNKLKDIIKELICHDHELYKDNYELSDSTKEYCLNQLKKLQSLDEETLNQKYNDYISKFIDNPFYMEDIFSPGFYLGFYIGNVIYDFNEYYDNYLKSHLFNN